MSAVVCRFMRLPTLFSETTSPDITARVVEENNTAWATLEPKKQPVVRPGTDQTELGDPYIKEDLVEGTVDPTL